LKLRMRISREYTFSAAHYIPGHPKCGVIHGHNYRVRVTLWVQPSALIDIDFSEIDDMMKPILNKLDHTMLNELLEVPTAEGLCLFIFNELQKKTNKIMGVRVWETENSFAMVTT